MKVQRTSPNLIMKTLEAINDYYKINSSRLLTKDEISDYLCVSKQNISKTLNTCITIGLIKEFDKKYSFTDQGQQLSNLENKEKPKFLGKLLLQFNPFLFFCEKINDGTSLNDAILKTIQVFKIQGSIEEVLKTFRSLGTYGGILTRKGRLGDEILPERIQKREIQNYSISVKSEAEARIFLMKKLRSEVYSFLPHDCLNNLVESLNKLELNTDDAISNSVQALEIFLKKIIIKSGLSFNSSNGLSQLAQNMKNPSLDSKHKNICNAIGSLRNMVDHGNIPDWTMTPETGFTSFYLTLSTINSVYSFIYDGTYVF